MDWKDVSHKHGIGGIAEGFKSAWLRILGLQVFFLSFHLVYLFSLQRSRSSENCFHDFA